MLRLSKKLMFAIEAVLEIAYNSRVKPLLSREINGRQGIPGRYLEQVLQELARADVIIRPKVLDIVKGGNHVVNNRRYMYQTQTADWMAQQLGLKKT